MNTQLILIASACLGLAACGGVGMENARYYDPQMARENGPVDITVVGAPAADRSAIAARIADSIRFNGAEPGRVRPIGTPDSGYRVTLVYGPVAHDLVAAGDSDNYASSCQTIDSQAGAALASTAPASGGPVAALMCYRNQYEAVAYANSSDAASVHTLVKDLFPPLGANR